MESYDPSKIPPERTLLLSAAVSQLTASLYDLKTLSWPPYQPSYEDFWSGSDATAHSVSSESLQTSDDDQWIESDGVMAFVGSLSDVIYNSSQ
jgi:hypothetical protein